MIAVGPGTAPLQGGTMNLNGGISGEDGVISRNPVVGAIGHEGSGSKRQLIQ